MYAIGSTWERVWMLMPPGEFTDIDYLEWLQMGLWQSNQPNSPVHAFCKGLDLQIVVPKTAIIKDYTQEDVVALCKEINIAMPGARKCYYFSGLPGENDGVLLQTSSKSCGVALTNTPIMQFPFSNEGACKNLLSTLSGHSIDTVLRDNANSIGGHSSGYSQNFPIMQIFYQSIGTVCVPKVLSTTAVKAETDFGPNSVHLCVSLEAITRPVFFKKPHGGFNFAILH